MAKGHSVPYRLYTNKYGVWQTYISFIANDGQRVQLRQTCRTKDRGEAEKITLKKIEILDRHSKLEAGEKIEITLDEAFGKYFEESGKFQSKADNLLLRLSRIKQDLNVKYLSNISPAIINEYINQRRKTVKASTINRDLAVISAILNRAKKFWNAHIQDINISDFKLKEPARIIHIFKDWEIIDKIIDVAPEHIKPIIYTAIYTGMRRGNILKLKWQDIDFENNIIHIKIKNNRIEGGKPHNVPLATDLKDILLKLPRINEYVFNYKNKPIKDIKTAWHTIFKQANLPYQKFHNLRHTAITWIIQKTGNPVIAQKIVGHTDIKTTMLYTHPEDIEKINAVNFTFHH